MQAGAEIGRSLKSERPWRAVGKGVVQYHGWRR